MEEQYEQRWIKDLERQLAQWELFLPPQWQLVYKQRHRGGRRARRSQQKRGL